METIRAFIAIELPPEIIKKIAEIQDRFKALNLDATWVKPSNIHLTLKFLGNINPQLLSKVKEVIVESLPPVPEFSISLGTVGVFPNIKQPRVLWIGVEETHQQLILLKSNIDKGLEPLGFEIDRKKFSPHLTLGRIKSAKGKSRLREMIQSFEKMDAEAIKVSSVKLMQSQLTPRGSIYTVLQAFKFQ